MSTARKMSAIESLESATATAEKTKLSHEHILIDLEQQLKDGLGDDSASDAKLRKLEKEVDEAQAQINRSQARIDALNVTLDEEIEAEKQSQLDSLAKGLQELSNRGQEIIRKEYPRQAKKMSELCFELASINAAITQGNHRLDYDLRASLPNMLRQEPIEIREAYTELIDNRPRQIIYGDQIVTDNRLLKSGHMSKTPPSLEGKPPYDILRLADDDGSLKEELPAGEQAKVEDAPLPPGFTKCHHPEKTIGGQLPLDITEEAVVPAPGWARHPLWSKHRLSEVAGRANELLKAIGF